MYKRLLLALALLSATPLAHAQDVKPTLKALDEKNGFRTLHFGDDASQLPNAKEIETDGDTKYYERTDENLKVGEANLRKITYGYYKGKLYFILIRTESLSDSRALKAALEAQYGSGYQSNRYIEDYSWLGKNVFLNYTENSINGSAKTIFSSEAIITQKAKDKKEAAKKAANDL